MSVEQVEQMESNTDVKLESPTKRVIAAMLDAYDNGMTETDAHRALVAIPLMMLEMLKAMYDGNEKLEEIKDMVSSVDDGINEIDSTLSSIHGAIDDASPFENIAKAIRESSGSK